MSENGFDTICPGCKYLAMDYNAKAEDYGCDGVGEYCNKSEYGVTRCPRAAQWRGYFKAKKGESK